MLLSKLPSTLHDLNKKWHLLLSFFYTENIMKLNFQRFLPIFAGSALFLAPVLQGASFAKDLFTVNPLPMTLSIQLPSQEITRIPDNKIAEIGMPHKSLGVNVGLAALKHAVMKRRWYSWGAGHASKPGPTYGVDDGASNHHTAPKRFGFDCSGFSRWFVYKASGRDLLGSSTAASQLGRASKLHAKVIPASRGYKALKAGDLLFYGNSSHVHHVAIYAGGGYIFEAPSSNHRVHKTTVRSHSDYYKAMRISF
jgi:NlpC/P60 family